MFNVVLYQPQIPPNTGNIIRLCANTGCNLHLIKPLGFDFNDKHMRRAGLDYIELAQVKIYENWSHFTLQYSNNQLVTFSTHHTRAYSDYKFAAHEYLLFGSETRGLPQDIRNIANQNARLSLPMHKNSRSLNLSNTVAVVVYEAWRQLGFR